MTAKITRTARSLAWLVASGLLLAGTAPGAGAAPGSAAARPACQDRTATRPGEPQAGSVTTLGAVELAAAAAPSTTVWMAGDSTMANATTCPIGWGSQFGAEFASNVTVANKAVAGRSIQTWLYESGVTSTMGSTGECTLSTSAYSTRWQGMLDASAGMKAGDYLFLQFGINDGDPACPRHVGTARYKELMGMMVKAALDRGAHPVVLTPVAAITCSGSTAVGNRGFLTETAAVASSYGIPLIDLHKLSVALYNRLGLCPNSGDYTTGAVGAFFCNDHTHFELAGARQIADVVASAVRSQGIGLGRYLAVNPLATATPTPTVTPTPSTPVTTPTSPSATATGSGGCVSTYRLVGSWSGGFQGEVTVTNTGRTAMTGWSVGLAFGGGQTVGQVWNGTASGTGSSVTVRNVSWNGTIPVGGSVTFGLIGTGTTATPTLTCGV